MSRRPVMTPTARVRAQRREMRKEMARIAERAKQRLQQAIAEGLHEGRIEEDGTIVIESDLAAVQATRVTMSSTATAKPRPLLRLNQKAELVPPAQFARWHEIASATAGLSRLELAILGAIAEHCRRLHVDGFAGGGRHRDRSRQGLRRRAGDRHARAHRAPAGDDAPGSLCGRA